MLLFMGASQLGLNDVTQAKVNSTGVPTIQKVSKAY